MKIKSYFAGSVEQAIQQAREELGVEAMLVTSRRSSPEARHLGAYEVVFGLPAQNAERHASPPAKDLGDELQILRAQLDDIKRTLQSSARPQGQLPAEIEELRQELSAAGLEDGTAREIADEVSAVWHATPAPQRSPGGRELLRQLASDCIREKLRQPGESSSPEPGARRVLVFAGPPGAGKTTTLTKIAIRECIAQRLSFRIISFDPDRAAAHEKLRSLAAILGAGFTAANSTQELIEAMDEFRNKDYVLIDTPGYAGGDFENCRDLIQYLGRLSGRKVHLVLPAYMNHADLNRCIRQFEEFRPDYLLFTRLDETESLGSILSAALEAAKPLSFFGTGQCIPDDLESAGAETLLQSLFRRERAEAISAA